MHHLSDPYCYVCGRMKCAAQNWTLVIAISWNKLNYSNRVPLTAVSVKRVHQDVLCGDKDSVSCDEKSGADEMHLAIDVLNYRKDCVAWVGRFSLVGSESVCAR